MTISLAGRNKVLFGESDILTNMSELSVFPRELLRCVNAFAQWKRAGVVVKEHLVLASQTFVYGSHTRVLLVEPGALDICLLLWIKVLGVHFTH
jgi:hypothetical protein